MGQMNIMGVNPSQIPPALYQQLIASQQNQVQNLGQNQNQQQSFARMANNGGGNANNNGANSSMGFSGIHETYQRLQSQESAKLEQQRLGMGFPGTAAPGQYQQLLALQSQSNMAPTGNNNAMMGALNYQNPQQPNMQPQPPQQQQQQNSNMAQSQQQVGMNMAAPQNSNMNFAQIQAILQASQQQVSQQHLQQQQQQQQQQQGGQAGGGQGSNALGMGGMGSQMNIHSQNQGLNLQSNTGESEQGRRQMLQG